MPEVRRLLLAVTEPHERFRFRLAWSTFRRRHQAVAKACHARRRSRQQAPLRAAPTVHHLERSDLDLTDQRWERIRRLLPPEQPKIGRPAKDHRLMLAGMLWVMRTGSAWRDLPHEFGPWQSIHTRHQRWRKAGIWQRILDTVNQEDDTDAS